MTANTAVYIDSKDIYFKFNSQDLSANITDSDFGAEFKINDITTYGKTGTVYAPSLDISTFSITFLFNQVATTGTQTVIGAAWYAKAAYAFELGPAGSTSGNTKISGNAWVNKYEIIGKVGNAEMVKADFKVDSGVTFGTYS